MALLYGVPAPVAYPRTLSPSEQLVGRDLYFRGDYEVGPHRDYLTVADVAAAKQSIEREALASPGDLPLHPDWGYGLRSELLRPDSKSVRDSIATRVRARVAANARIQEVEDVEVFRDANTDALTTQISAVAVGRTSSGSITGKVLATITTGGRRQ